MTYEEAIKTLKSMKPIGAKCADACDIAIEAIEKRAPIKPISKYGRVHNVCPNCETDSSFMVILFGENYCPECGQRIDWSK